MLYQLLKGSLLVTLFLFYACSSDTVVAKVNDHELLQSDMKLAMEGSGYSMKNKEDIKKFINDWSVAMAMADELDEKYPKYGKQNKIRTEFFLGELAEYSLTEEKLRLKVDTLVTEEQMLEYYNKNAEEFTLQDFIVKALFLKIPKEAKVLDKVKTSFLLKNDKDIAKIESYAKLYAEDFYFDDENWIFFNKLKSKMPIKGIDKDNMVLNRTKTYYTDDQYYYFINILDYKVKDDVSPLEFVKEQVKGRILANRMNEKRELFQKKLNLEIINKHDIEVYL